MEGGLATPQSPPEVSPERRAAVDRARQSWISRLVDLSRRNNLLYFRDLKVGTLDLSHVAPTAMRKLLQSGRATDDGVPFTELFESADRTRAAASLKEIATRARGNFEERGLDTLFLAMGLAEWTADDGGRDASAPVILVPVEVVERGTRAELWKIRRAGDVRVSDVLVHALTTEHGITVDPDALLRELQGDDEDEEFDPEPLFARLRTAADRVPAFRIAPRWVLGNFAFQKMAIVRDLKDLLEALASHNIIAALSGDQGAAGQARGDRSSVDPREFDAQPPDADFLIRDADSSQQQAIATTLRGQNGVISGPPGTGKSQTISNLIAELVARGKTVLFVAEKRAALDVVLNRLRSAGLGHLCLDCHGADVSRKLIAAQLQESVALVREAPLPNTAETHQAFVDRRTRLNVHAQAMHVPRSPSGLGLQALYGKLQRFDVDAESSVRFTGPVLKRLEPATVTNCCELMGEMQAMADVVLGQSASPWVGARVTTEVEARAALEQARRLAHETLPEVSSALDAVVTECGLSTPATMGDVRRLLRTLAHVASTGDQFDQALFEADLPALESSLHAARSFMGRVMAQVFNARYRAALRSLRGWHKQEALTPQAAFDAVTRTKALAAEWQQLGGPLPPRVASRWPRLSSAWKGVVGDLEALGPVLPNHPFDGLSLDALTDLCRRLAGDTVTPGKVRRLFEIRKALDANGVSPVVAEVVRRQPPPAAWPEVLRYAWIRSCIDDAQMSDTSLTTFDGRRHDEIAREFRELDEARLRLAVQRVGRAHAQAAIQARNQFPQQGTIVQKEAQKKTRHMPLRRLFTEAPDVLLALRPCWMASPLSVSQLLPGDRPYFDVVVFDEASQVLPEDAVTSLLRGRQAVVAGDQRQLPPTTFFASGSDQQDNEDDGTAGFQSILDQMTAFLDPPWSLDWHYRSRDEALIAYSNHRIYGSRLVTFPGARSASAIRHELVPHVPGAGGQEQSAAREVTRVVELILEQARTRPNESLGVITMGIAHANRIEAELYRVREEHPDLEPFFAVDRQERFFVKNLERVQGDERDAIILSVGYGKNEAGHVVYRFGPLLQEGGERRLNVAITRARNRMTVVSSFSHADLDPAYPKEGVKHLRGYLEYAASGGRSFGFGTLTEVPLNDFEQSVRDELSRRGMTMAGQVGSSRYRIDLVALHPEKPGRYVLAIECDGATYHSAPTARDRDRLRQQQLEALGWRFCRIWSTDWFLRREEEVQRVLKAYQEAIRAADEDDANPDGQDEEVDLFATAPAPAQPSIVPETTRAARPSVSPGLPIDAYSHGDLVRMVDWVRSDGRLHTNAELLNEVMRALEFRRRGTRIVERISAAIATANAR